MLDTLTIEIRNPKVRELSSTPLRLTTGPNLISILPQKPTWAEHWRALSDLLPGVPQISEQEILDEISAVRQSKVA